MAEVIPIRVRVEPENIDQTKRKIIRAADDIEEKAEQVGKNVSQDLGRGFTGALDRMKRSARGFVQVAKGVGLVGLLFAVADGLTRIVTAIPRTIKLFDDLSASLLVVTNSSEDANEALQILLDLSEQTATPVAELTRAFSRLRLLGLDPTNETLTNFAALARGLTRPLDQITEAVADAATGEFERLKELGFAYRRQGREVELTFRGVTRTVAIESQAIQGYLEEIGRTQFGNVFEAQANTIQTALSELNVAFQGLVRDIAGDTLPNLFVGVVRTFTRVIRWIQNTFVPEFQLAWLSIREFVESQWEIISSIVTFNLNGLDQRLSEIEARYTALRREVTEPASERAREISTIPGGGRPGGTSQELERRIQSTEQAQIDSWLRLANIQEELNQRTNDILTQQDQQRIQESTNIVEAGLASWERGFENFVTTGKLSFSGLIDGMIADLARLGVNRIFQLLISGPGGAGSGGGLAGVFAGLFANAKGNVVQRYASGGLIDRPTIFPARRGLALAGEAGTEAIMPLQRDRRGNLGVSGGTAGTVNNYYINAIDTQSFADAARRSGAIPGLVAESIEGNKGMRKAILGAR